jgi:hypothetical protein
LIICVKEALKKPNLLLNNVKKQSPYMFAMMRYNYSIQSLKAPKKELTEELLIKKSQVKAHFTAIVVLIMLVRKTLRKLLTSLIS